jgi:hypothetical protein
MRVTVTEVVLVLTTKNSLPPRSGTMRDTQDHDGTVPLALKLAKTWGFLLEILARYECTKELL